MRGTVLAVAVAAFAAAGVSGEVRLTVGRDGKKVISNVGSYAHESNYNVLAKLRNRPSRFDAFIDRYATQYRVDPVLVRAVIQVESDFNPRCISRRGARGLMQLMPETARRYGVRSIFDPDENIRGGIRYLADLLELFPRDLPRVLAAYNAGENAVARYAGIPPFEETTTYIKRALTVYYGRPWGDAVWFRGSQGGPKLAGGVSLLEPLATLPGMRILGNR